MRRLNLLINVIGVITMMHSRLRNGEGLFILLILLASILLINLVDALPQLESKDGILWTVTSNENQKDWLNYTRNVSGFDPIDVIIKNHPEGNLIFYYKTNNEDGYLDISFICNNGTPQKLLQRFSYTKFFPSLNVKRTDELKLRFRARDSSKIYQFWIGFQNYTQHLISIPTPVIPKGRDSGYLGEKYAYSTKISSFEPDQKIRYIFNWSDGIPDNVTEPLEVGKDAIVFHTWIKRGEHTVKACALTMQNDSGNWSSRANVTIYNKTTVSQDLQKAINISDDYTELILNKSVYNVDEIKIQNKNHLIIGSSRGYVKLEGQNVKNRISINNSTFIKITRLILTNSKNGIRINNSYHLNLTDNQVVFGCYKIGILLNGGGYNIILANKITNITDLNKKRNTSVGIEINDSKNNFLKDNIIKPSDTKGKLYHYFITTSDELNNTIIVSNLNRIKGRDLVMQNKCVASWNDNGFVPGECSNGDECEIWNNCDNPHMWRC